MEEDADIADLATQRYETYGCYHYYHQKPLLDSLEYAVYHFLFLTSL